MIQQHVKIGWKVTTVQKHNVKVRAVLKPYVEIENRKGNMNFPFYKMFFHWSTSMFGIKVSSLAFQISPGLLS